jgi:NADH-quinone oxidoreductase subunit L
MLIGCLSLAGAPLVGSGFYSKDEIVAAAWKQHWVLGAVMLLTAFLTAYYTFRLYFRVFEGPEILPEAPPQAHGHGSHDTAGASAAALETHTTESSGVDVGQTHHEPVHHGEHDHHHEPNLMIVPLIILAIGAFFAGYINWPAEKLGEFLHESPSFALAQQVANEHYGETNVTPSGFGAEERDKEVASRENTHHLYMMIVSGLIALAGIGLAYQLHLKDRAASDRLAVRLGGLTRLLEGKYWVDEIYQAWIVEPLRHLGRAFFVMDRMIIDGIVWLIGFIPQASGFTLKLTTQRGYLQGYAATMLFGIAIILLVVFW